MSDEWYIRDETQLQGPLSFDDLKRLVEAGRLFPSTSISPDGERGWMDAQEITGLFPGVYKRVSTSEESHGGLPNTAVPSSRPVLENTDRSGLIWTMKWLRRTASEIRLTALLTWTHLISLTAYARAVWKRRSQTHEAYRARLTLGKELYRRNLGDEHVLRRISEVEDRIESIQHDKGSTRQLESERRGLLIRLALETVSQPEAIEQRDSLLRAEDAVTRQVEVVADHRRELRPTSHGHALRIAVGYVTCLSMLSFVGSWLRTPTSPTGTTSSGPVANTQIGNGASANASQTQQDEGSIRSWNRREDDEMPIRPDSTDVRWSEFAQRRQNSNPLVQTNNEVHQRTEQIDQRSGQLNEGKRTKSAGHAPTAKWRFSSGFATDTNPGHWQPRQGEQRRTYTTTSKSYVVSGFGGLARAGLDQTLGAIRAGREIRRDIDARMAAARNRFWREYPNGKELNAAQAEFERLLFEKDLAFMGLYMVEGSRGKMANFWEMTTGKWDNGIQPFAWREFDRWVNAVREELGAKAHRGDEPDIVMFWKIAELPQAIMKTRHLFDAYALKRDWAEFEAAGYESHFYPTPRDYVMFLIRTGEDAPSYGEAERIYAQMAEAIGEEPLLSAAARLRNAPKNKKGGVENYEALFTNFAAGRSASQRAVFTKLIGQHDLVGYALYLDMDRTSRRKWWEWSDARRNLDLWFAAYGRQPVLAAVERIRKAPKLINARRKAKWKGERFVVEAVPGTEYKREVYLADWKANGFVDVSSWASLKALIHRLEPVNPELVEKLTPKGAIIAETVNLDLPRRTSGIDADGRKLLVTGRNRETEVWVFDISSGKEIASLKPSFGEVHPSVVKHYPALAADSSSAALFGNSFALCGDLAIVGSPNCLLRKRSGGAATQQTQRFPGGVGAASVFDVTTGRQLHLLLPTKILNFQHFGTSVDIDGEIAVVGASDHGENRGGRAAIYVFHARTGKHLHRLAPPNPEAEDHFGTNVAIERNRVVASAVRTSKTAKQLVAYVFDVPSGKLLHTLTCPPVTDDSQVIDSAAIALTGDVALLGTVSFNLKTGKRLATISETPAQNLGYTGEASLDIQANIAIVGTKQRTVHLFDIMTGQKLADVYNETLNPKRFSDLQSVAIENDVCWIDNGSEIYRLDVGHLISH